MRVLLLIIFLVGCHFICLSQKRAIKANKTTSPVKLDANLDDAAWKDAAVITDFIILSPDFGKSPTRKTEVKILYDNSAIYFAAYMYDDPTKIRKQLTSRDVIDRQDVDYFAIGLDTYLDKQNAFVFQVTAAGVQGDAKLSGGGDDDADWSWDAVWESKTMIREDGWVAEVRIPFSAIRFAKTPLQSWGMQLVRFSRSNNENISWSPEDPNINGTINQWGEYRDLQNITPPLRLSFLPYLSTGVKYSPTSNGNVTEHSKSGGMDVKYGINESFTLDVTLIPDFAQVQSDNVVLNLSPFEIQFQDYRPFFTEGTELFNKAGLFYSRRIGKQPTGTSSILDFAMDSSHYTIQKNPAITKLYNATKLSGRTRKNLGIGVLNALTATMEAQLLNRNTGEIKHIETEPLTNYNILVLDQAFKNRSSLTFTNTNVLRKGNSRNANVAAVDLALYDKKNVHSFTFGGRYSKIWGKNLDQGGFRTDGEYSKISGKITYRIGGTMMSDTYDPNDMGLLFNNNSVTFRGGVSYNLATPTEKFIRRRFSLSFSNNYLYKPFNWQRLFVSGNAFFYLKNFWDVTFFAESQPLWSNDYFEPRTAGKVLRRSPYYFIGISGSTDSRKKMYVSFFFGGAESPLPSDPYYEVELGFRYRFSDKFQLSFDNNSNKDKRNFGFVTRDVQGAPLIGRRNIDNHTTILSGNYNFNSKMNITMRMRHSWSKVHYTDVYDLLDDGNLGTHPFINGLDNNFNSFNVDMFYTWDFLLGSRLTFGWKNALGNDVRIDALNHENYFKNFRQIFSNPHSNEITLKLVYYLDYLSLRKRKSN